MIKMYLEFNNGNNGLLLTDGNRWIYIDAYEINADISKPKTAEENIREAIEAGDLYEPEDLFDECLDQEHEIEEYRGMTIEEIDRKINYIDGMSKGHDITIWKEIV